MARPTTRSASVEHAILRAQTGADPDWLVNRASEIAAEQSGPER